MDVRHDQAEATSRTAAWCFAVVGLGGCLCGAVARYIAGTIKGPYNNHGITLEVQSQFTPQQPRRVPHALRVSPCQCSGNLCN
ncbi:hypothetical protein QBC41DRAFT_141251 [Cercophora samala]|uniref:Uncharacterized protein n=1 Tax=Cercophora samala TaxID=330535 RepID=A0AA40D8I2_9PEZI|nr:hypothetical protein QBC41DRAFT_141251 [Cercophora samala]